MSSVMNPARLYCSVGTATASWASKAAGYLVPGGSSGTVSFGGRSFLRVVFSTALSDESRERTRIVVIVRFVFASRLLLVAMLKFC